MPLSKVCKDGAEKVLIAHRLRAETMMTLNWIMFQLTTGTAGHLANPLRDVENDIASQ